ncbi:unnamed protein product [Cylindrotheca closterium]|uniref:4-hydroxybenzoate polyprenyltransferase, mitochondrial n=1 Tax=Cylindrotheca closterium TaxID=2856 RepID=A0AAD2FPR2_9STRA|nr:unnamed protein product [Cylindrotheca closterium]
MSTLSSLGISSSSSSSSSSLLPSPSSSSGPQHKKSHFPSSPHPYHCWTQKHSFHSTLPSASTNDKEQKLEKNDTIRSTATTSDPPILTWYDPYVAEWMGPYLRLARVDKPIGTWLLLWPCLWSTAMAASAPATTTITASSSTSLLLPDPYLMGLFTVGSFVMRGSGCTINDMWDQDFDKRVARTKSRPLASGELNSTQAIGFLGLQLATGLGVLLSLPNMEYCFMWGVSSLPLVVMYPLMKRFTNFPQVFLGLTFNWGAWMGWAATYGSMNYAVIAPLYLSGVCWTVVYDTIYANQDKHDDKAIGLKSTALTFGEDETKHKQILHGFAALTFVQWLAAGYMMEDISMVPYSAGMSLAYSHLLWQIQTAELDNPQNLADRFRSNTGLGGIVFAAIVAGKVL